MNEATGMNEAEAKRRGGSQRMNDVEARSIIEEYIYQTLVQNKSGVDALLRMDESDEAFFESLAILLGTSQADRLQKAYSGESG